GWSGKQHACAQLARAAQHDRLLFMDADVRLAPDALNRMVRRLDRGKAAMISGFPREETGSFVEHLLIPMIHVLLLGFLPIPAMRIWLSPGFGAACGQLIMVRRGAYEDAGGHGAIRASRHDGLTLPRAFRRHRHMTDLFDATDLAACRMYEGQAETVEGFMKNANEGMATPRALPVWTLLLFGGQVMPILLLIFGAVNGMSLLAWNTAALAVLAGYGMRAALAVQFRQSWLGVLLHPIGVLWVLAIQWRALLRSVSGRTTVWRGRPA
ncbi:MAG: glycosyltransferase, partial [Rhizobiales bacterium]|nr:glycosyltransferase [Hyphomicrobiales bacterium]